MFKKDFDSITKGLTKMVADLQTLSSKQIDAATAARDRARKAEQEAFDAEADADRARATADKIASLLS